MKKATYKPIRVTIKNIGGTTVWCTNRTDLYRLQARLERRGICNYPSEPILAKDVAYATAFYRWGDRTIYIIVNIHELMYSAGYKGGYDNA